jgi:hypothetical protein
MGVDFIYGKAFANEMADYASCLSRFGGAGAGFLGENID